MILRLPYNVDVDVLRESPTRAINRVVEQLRRRGLDVIMLSTGEPGVPPPREVRMWLSKFLEEESMRLYSYTPSPGFLDLREAIVDDLRDLGGIELSSDQVVVVSGGQAAMFSTLASILTPGDEVILMDPTYFGYWNLLAFFKAKPKPIVANLDREFQPDIEAIKEAIVRGKTKALILVSPDNPTGRILDWSTAKAIADIAQDYKLWIIYDEPYRTLVYEGEHIYMYKLAPENTISLYAFSKDPGIPGWRLGYVYGPQWIIKKIGLVSEAITYNPPSIAQYLVLTYLRNREVRRRHIDYVRSVYVKKRDVMVEELSKIRGAEFFKPKGAMFIMANLESILKPVGYDGGKLAEKLLLEKHVAVIPGEFFGRSTTFYIRLSFPTETVERIREGVERIREALEDLK